ncbi:PaaI family thioesterase [Nocardioides sp. AE5]|uniref:PaaI family thioesterase n=1 Tax=Nocardioides sp. AE5 TaxID=2962573 RepID=UPI002881A770|nr:PaaI family thioesterase [Nocardioides sp. AE5]MDT0203038.1 PaaI family thioesterase [Nocardioides sp. AE5]
MRETDAPDRPEQLPAWANPNTHAGGPHFGEMIDQVRRVMDAARVIDPDDALASGLIADLAAIATRMEAAAATPSMAPGDSRIDLPGRGNVALPPFTMVSDGPDGVVAETVFRTFHLGEGAAHGGYVSLFFDELAGYAAMHAISDGMPRTAFLKVDYRSLTPVGRTLTGKVWVEGTEGRKLFLRGSLHDGERLCAEMEALFLTVPMPRL